MTKQEVWTQLLTCFFSCDGNVVLIGQGGENSAAGLELFQTPLIGYASAQDPLFTEYKKPGVIGPWFMEPQEWLPGARTVISIFFPFSAAVCNGELRAKDRETSPEWLYGRIEGQQFLARVVQSLARWLTEQGVRVCVPAADSRFSMITGGKTKLHDVGITQDTYGSNWSERHAAYLCGLGTFSLTRAVITEKGSAGRFGSLITDLDLEPDSRPYIGLYDYCSGCGVCVRRCPAQAISLESGKRQDLCAEYCAETGVRYAPRYGCGKCQIDVPCQSHIPRRVGL